MNMLSYMYCVLICVLMCSHLMIRLYTVKSNHIEKGNSFYVEDEDKGFV